MSSDLAIHARGLGKAYAIYRRPEDRLKQMLWRRRRRFYDEYWALRDIDLDVYRGETVGLIGRNGAGKSTFLQMICGTLTPTCGELTVNGRIAALLELGAGFNPEFSGRENVHLAASILGLTPEEIRDRFEAIAEFAGIGDFIDQPVKFYSSGMYARLAFAVAAHVDADILIVDEILAVGDAAFVQKCMRYIRRFKETGTLFFVSHDTSAIINLCDRAVWLEDGTIRECGPARDVCFNYMAAIEGEKESDSTFRIGGSRLTRPLDKPPPADFTKTLMQRAGVEHRGEVVDLDLDRQWFGRRQAVIVDVVIHNAQGEVITSFNGGEEIVLTIVAKAEHTITQPIIGFVVKDRLGQVLFAENTYMAFSSQEITVEAGHRIAASFRFVMPYLQTGDYSLSPAIATGTQLDHVQQHWAEDAMIIRIVSNHIIRGLVGIAFQSISFEILPAEMLPAEQDPS
jgi:lipopolysaccharide transport system ATP-binding protein